MEDTNEPMVGGPYRPVLTDEGSDNRLPGYWIEDDKGLHFYGTRFYRADELEEAKALCILLNAAWTEGKDSA